MALNASCVMYNVLKMREFIKKTTGVTMVQELGLKYVENALLECPVDFINKMNRLLNALKWEPTSTFFVQRHVVYLK